MQSLWVWYRFISTAGAVAENRGALFTAIRA